METILKYLLVAMALIAVITGLNVLIGGSAAVPGAVSAAEATVDNELRFFSCFWVAYGVLCFWISRDIERKMIFVPYVALVFFVGGLGRLASVILVGLPATPLLAAMILEFVIPVVIFLLYRNRQQGLTASKAGV